MIKEITFETVENAKSSTDLFDSDSLTNRVRYLKFSKILHPDANPDNMQKKATDAFAKLTQFYNESLGPVTPKATWILSTKKHSYVAESVAFMKGDIANLYSVTWMNGEAEMTGVLKIPRKPNQSNIIQHEASILRRLQKEGIEKFRCYVPAVYDLFRHRDNATKATRACMVMEGLEGFYSLAEVMEAYPHYGITGRDIAWIWRRLLVALGFAHRVGIVHGAVWPEHVMIHPEMHGLVLVGWGQSTEIGGKISIIDPAYESQYPSEVLNRQPVNEATDIHMAAITMLAAMGSCAPKGMRAFGKGCTLEKNSMRPHDAWELKDEFDELLENMYGKRKFTPFYMPIEAKLHEA